MTTSNETLNFEHAYIEMRNLLAYTLNVIAGEIGDGVTPIDDGVERRQLAYDIVCTQTHALHKSVHPTTLDQHDELIKKFEHYLTFVSCHPDLGFTNKHPELNEIRYRDFYNDLDNEETHLIEEPKKTNISVIRNIGIIALSFLVPNIMLGGLDIGIALNIIIIPIVFLWITCLAFEPWLCSIENDHNNRPTKSITKRINQWFGDSKNITQFIHKTIKHFFFHIGFTVPAICFFMGLLTLSMEPTPQGLKWSFPYIQNENLNLIKLGFLFSWLLAWSGNAIQYVNRSKAYE